MEIRGMAELTIVFDEADVQAIQVGDRTGYRIGPLFAGESLAQQLAERTGQPTRVAVRLRSREIDGRTYLSAVVTDVLDLPAPAAPAKPSAPSAKAPTKVARNGQAKKKPISLRQQLAD